MPYPDYQPSGYGSAPDLAAAADWAKTLPRHQGQMLIRLHGGRKEMVGPMIQPESVATYFYLLLVKDLGQSRYKLVYASSGAV